MSFFKILFAFLIFNSAILTQTFTLPATCSQKILKADKKVQKKIEKSQINSKYNEIINRYNGKNPSYWGRNAPGVINNINTNQKIVVLTLDACDARSNGYDKELIDFLIKENIPATLFINARWIKKYPDEFLELSKNKLFEIENHGFHHLPASINGKSVYGIKGTANVRALIDEVDVNANNIKNITGRKPLYFRSGTAYYDEYAVKVIEDLGYKPVGFSILGDSGATYSKRKINSVISKAKPGDIIICHMNRPESQTAEGLTQVLPKLKKKGFKFVLLSDYNKLLK